jgi:hypothetical protein
VYQLNHIGDSSEINSRPVGVGYCIPVYNDWECVLQLLRQIDATSSALPDPIHIVLVDDGSTDSPTAMPLTPLGRIAQIDVIQLRRNVGHQRAIALGLAFMNVHINARFVVVMDGDGEDSPSDVGVLIRRCEEVNSCKVVFAKRRKRSEGLTFRLGYFAYQWLHFVLTGKGVDIGNFSVIPTSLLPNVVGISELWNHYASGVMHARLPIVQVPIDRAKRFSGESKMNLVALVTHGMCAIAVYGDTVGIRLLCVTSGMTCVVLIGLIAVFGIRLLTDLAIPGWATNAVGILAAILLNLLMLSGIFVLFILQSRSMAGFLPIRDWKDYVAHRITIYKR